MINTSVFILCIKKCPSFFGEGHFVFPGTASCFSGITILFFREQRFVFPGEVFCFYNVAISMTNL